MENSVSDIERSSITLDFDSDAGWSKSSAEDVTCWFAGYLADGSQGQAAANYIAEQFGSCIAGGSSSRISGALQSIDGHFALAVGGPSWTLAAVDAIRSIPLSIAETPTGLSVSPSARRLVDASGFSQFNADAVLSFGMAGYTIGRTTLYRDVVQLMPGEFLYSSNDQTPEVGSYWRYRPKGSNQRDRATLRRALVDATLQTLERLVASSVDRPIIVPLSAGLDSRLVVSGLHHMGVRDVRCFAYGRPGNFEAEASRKIAEHLGYEWTFVPYSLAQQRQTFASADHRAFMAFADHLCALPFLQDFHAVQVLRNKGYIPASAVIVNGQSGDYLTGNHIPTELWETPDNMDKEKRWSRIVSAMIEKHFSHWQLLKTPANLSSLELQLRHELVEADVDFDREPIDDFGIYESLEFRNRQAKYVVGGQRVYDYHGLDWRLPLWDKSYISFWQDVPLDAKKGRNLFRDMLVEQNWGGVWQSWDFPQRTTPISLAAVRFTLKSLHAPFGQSRWHRFERCYLHYFMDLLCNYAVASYGQVVRDKRGFRNGLSWHIEAYLRDKGLGLDGKPITSWV
jgi:asparagine synthase (glutamine-hydrolysing)